MRLGIRRKTRASNTFSPPPLVSSGTGQVEIDWGVAASLGQLLRLLGPGSFPGDACPRGTSTLVQGQEPEGTRVRR